MKSLITPAPPSRVVRVNDRPERPEGAFVLYWMTGARRVRWSYGLQHAIAHAQRLGRPLLVLEGVRVGYRWASDRHHRFILDGMADNAARLANSPVGWRGYVEPTPGAGSDLLRQLGALACCFVTDHFPGFFLPRMVQAAGRALPVCLERVDSNGLLPLSAHERAFTTAASFRRHLQKTLRPHLLEPPVAEPLRDLALPPFTGLPPELERRFTPAEALTDPALLRALPIDHSVGPVATRGGSARAEARLQAFLDQDLDRYGEERNHPDARASSGLSPYLHYGHISAHEVVSGVWRAEGWRMGNLAAKPNGSREGWWGMGPSAEGFLDELITWRELGYGFADQRPDDHERYEALPPWALTTLDEHRRDARPRTYDLADLAAGNTHDPLWNAAQRELRESGLMHNYLRMLWGKKVLEWSETPEEGLEALIELNNRYAIDGRDPNSTSGIFWVFGRFDRAWGPERPIFGKVRYMSSDATLRKLDLKRWLARWGDD